MNDLILQLRDLPVPAMPGSGETALRHRALAEIGRHDLSLARLAEAHFDALAILAEAGRKPAAGAVYGVWASEIPGHALTIRDNKLFGKKRFCTGAGLLDRAVVTATDPEHRLIDIDLQRASGTFSIDSSEWITTAFANTSTATITFQATPFDEDNIIGPSGWYLDRAGFWPGAIGPAACWAGGAVGLVDWALAQKRNDPHSLAHLGAMEADAWQLRSILSQSGDEVDAHPRDIEANHKLALTVRHLIEQSCMDVLTRIGRAYGPHPLAFDSMTSRRYSEVELYVRQCHAERDLQLLGELSRDFVFDPV